MYLWKLSWNIIYTEHVLKPSNLELWKINELQICNELICNEFELQICNELICNEFEQICNEFEAYVRVL